jgi:hypothetical protein
VRTFELYAAAIVSVYDRVGKCVNKICARVHTCPPARPGLRAHMYCLLFATTTADPVAHAHFMANYSAGNVPAQFMANTSVDLARVKMSLHNVHFAPRACMSGRVR